MIDLVIPKKKFAAKKFQILYFFLLQKEFGWQDRISIDQHSGYFAYFIIVIISYDQYCFAKILIASL